MYKCLLTGFLCCLACMSADGQVTGYFASDRARTGFSPGSVSTERGSWANLKPDPKTIRNFGAPTLIQMPSPGVPGRTYWLGSTATMGFNNGRIGTTYFYDASGNLRDVRTYIDISGKGRRGLKILLPLR